MCTPPPATITEHEIEMATPSNLTLSSDEFGTPTNKHQDMDDLDLDLDMDMDLDELLNKASESLALQKEQNGEEVGQKKDAKGYSVLEELKKYGLNF
jgi:hypothetical protein